MQTRRRELPPAASSQPALPLPAYLESAADALRLVLCPPQLMLYFSQPGLCGPVFLQAANGSERSGSVPSSSSQGGVERRPPENSLTDSGTGPLLIPPAHLVRQVTFFLRAQELTAQLRRLLLHTGGGWKVAW